VSITPFTRKNESRLYSIIPPAYLALGGLYYYHCWWTNPPRDSINRRCLTDVLEMCEGNWPCAWRGNLGYIAGLGYTLFDLVCSHPSPGTLHLDGTLRFYSAGDDNIRSRRYLSLVIAIYANMSAQHHTGSHLNRVGEGKRRGRAGM